MSESKVRFTCYLLRQTVREPGLALRAKYRPGGPEAMTLVASAVGAPTGSSAWMRLGTEKPPPWARAIDAHFPGVGDAVNTSNRLVIFLPVGGRIFAVCFGYGSSTLEWEAIEQGFGLRVAARLMNPDSIRALSSRRIDSSARSQQVQIAGGSQLRDLDLRLEGEFVRRLVGGVEDSLETVDGAIVGSDAISFQHTADLASLVATLSEMLDASSRDPNDAFGFVDALVPIPASSPQVRDLEDALIASLGPTADEPAILQMAAPDAIDVEDLDRIVISRNGHEVELEALTIDALRAGLAELGGRFGRASLKQIRVLALDSNGDPSSQFLSLKDWLVYETTRGTSRFILTLGRWFRLDTAFSDLLDRDLRRIVDVTVPLGLPVWPRAWDEGEYNAKVSDPRFVCLDKVRLMTDGFQVEAADLFSDTGDLVHVKRYSGSQTLSHLFSQGSVSATVLNEDRSYKNDFVEAVESLSGGHREVADRAPQQVVFAIGVEQGKKIPDDLPTFSKVNLRDHARRLRQARVTPALARIQIV